METFHPSLFQQSQLGFGLDRNCSSKQFSLTQLGFGLDGFFSSKPFLDEFAGVPSKPFPTGSAWFRLGWKLSIRTLSRRITRISAWMETFHPSHFSLNQMGFSFIQAFFLLIQLGSGLDGNSPSKCFPTESDVFGFGWKLSI